MKKIVRLTEDDLTRIVKRVILEQTTGLNTDKGKQPKMVKDPMTGELQKVIEINTLGYDLKFGVNKNIKFFYLDDLKSFEVVDVDNKIRYHGNLK